MDTLAGVVRGATTAGAGAGGLMTAGGVRGAPGTVVPAAVVADGDTDGDAGGAAAVVTEGDGVAGAAG